MAKRKEIEIRPVGENRFLIYFENGLGVQPIKVFDNYTIMIKWRNSHNDYYDGGLRYRVLDQSDAADIAIIMDKSIDLVRYHERQKVDDPNRVVFYAGKPWKTLVYSKYYTDRTDIEIATDADISAYDAPAYMK